MTNDLIFVSAQPDVPYFHWQTKVYTHNFIRMGIKPDKIHVLYAMVNGNTPTQESLELKEIGVNVHHYKDIRTDRTYIPSLRPMILKEWLKGNPELGKCYFYHDSDIIFRELPDFEKLMADDVCYLSNTISYIGYNYILDCCKRYESVHNTLKPDQLLEEMCNIIGIDVDVVKNNQDNSGGAQYLIKNTDHTFWDKVFIDSITLYDFLSSFHRKYPIQHEIQMWTSDMWAVLWNIWRLGKETKITDKLDFSWATDNLDRYNKYPILHMAGVTQNLKDRIFYKGEYININPLEKLKINPNHFDYIDKNSSTIKYIEEMMFLTKNK